MRRVMRFMKDAKDLLFPGKVDMGQFNVSKENKIDDIDFEAFKRSNPKEAERISREAERISRMPKFWEDDLPIFGDDLPPSLRRENQKTTGRTAG